MDWLSYAADLNRNGAMLLEARNHELALECFKGALEIMSLLAIGFKNGNSTLVQAAAAGLVYVPTQPQILLESKAGKPWTATGSNQEESSTQTPFSLPSSQQPPDNNYSDGENHYLFEKGLNFTPPTNGTVLSPHLLSFYIAVIEFNMALSLHLLSRRLGERPLHNALHVYDYCLEHLSRSGCSMESSKLLLFAALNNKAAILYDLSSFQMARDVLASLFDAINSCRKTGVLSTIDDRDLEGFLFNVMLLRGACIAPAA